MKVKQIIHAMLLLLTLLVMLTLPAYALSEPSVLQVKIELLTKELEAKRQEYHIPGLAIAIVKDDKIIMSKGFGVMDVENQKAVSTDTLFAIGSTSKAFTATLMGMLVDQEKIAWDDKITKYIPGYQFKSEGKYLPITIRDMLSHRTGYTRNDLLWANGTASRELILQTAPKAEPWDEFRKNFYYNNVMYLAAGVAAAKQASTSWDDLLSQNILNPLGMNNSTSIHEVAMQNNNISLGYLWNDVTEQYDLLPRRNLNNVAPAGGIYSNVNDMAKWVKLLLNNGTFNGQTLISEKQLMATREAQIKVAGGVNYGMGWFLREWQNQPVVEHGGSIDGYAAQVALLPESNLGFVLLTNVTATPLQQASMNMVWEHLIDSPNPDTEKAITAIDYNEFVGEYQANFASFKDAIFSFKIKQDGKPAVDVPGQMVYELRDPDETGKWYFAMTDTISISFDRADDGSIAAMRMHQSRMDFELPKKGVEIEAEIDSSELQMYLGQYESKTFNGQVNVFIQNHRLTLDVPNEMAFELHLPDADGFRQFRIKSDMSAVFESNEQNVVTQFVLYRDKEKIVDTATKIVGNIGALPSVDDIMKMRKTVERQKAFKKDSGYTLTGSINMANSGITGTLTTSFDEQHNYRQHMNFGQFGEILVVTNENSGATIGINPYTEFKGKYLKQIKMDHPAVWLDWRDHYDSVKVTGFSEHKGKKVYVLSLKTSEIPSVTVYLDAKTGDVVKQQIKLLNPIMGRIPMTIEYEGYQEQYGLRFPLRTTLKNPMNGKVVINYTEIKAKQKFDANVFDTSKPK